MKTLYDSLNVLPSTTIHRMPSSCRATLAEKAVFTGRETFVLNKGKIYAPSGNTNNHHRAYMDAEVQALVALGVFTKAHLEDWRSAKQGRDTKRRMRQEAADLGQNMKVLGIKPTKAQQAKLDAILGNMTKERAS